MAKRSEHLHEEVTGGLEGLRRWDWCGSLHVDQAGNREALLVRFYRRYLDDEESARFVSSVAHHYTTGTLARLSASGEASTRRAATLAVGLLGDFRDNAVLGRRLQDADRGVRVLAENGIRALWRRDGAVHHRRQLGVIIRQIGAEQLDVAIEAASQMLDDAPWFAEVWNQRAIAYFQQQRFEQSAADCAETLELNPFHFAAAVGMAHCHLELDEAFLALDCFRRALRLNPDMEGVRAQVEYLQRTLEDQA